MGEHARAGLAATAHAPALFGPAWQVVVREADFPAPAERLALCAVYEAYDVPYEYWDDQGRVQLATSPYALLMEEKAELDAVALL